MSKAKGKAKEKAADVFERVKHLQSEQSALNEEKQKYDLTTIRGLYNALLNRIKAADLSGTGAQLAYFFLLALFPLLLFVMTLLPFLNLPQKEILDMLDNMLPKEVNSLIQGVLIEVLNNRSGGLLSVGALGTLWSASNGINALMKGLNRSYGKKETRPFILARSLSVVFTILFIVMIVVALVLFVFGQQIGKFLFSNFGLGDEFQVIWTYLRLIIPPLFVFLVLAFIYWVGPNVQIALRNVWVGAIFATVVWIGVSFGFSFYVSNFSNYTATYGSIGGIIILMLWLYLTGIIFTLGGQINAIMQQRKEQIAERTKSEQLNV